jgi:hypothetical protein
VKVVGSRERYEYRGENILFMTKAMIKSLQEQVLQAPHSLKSRVCKFDNKPISLGMDLI